SCIILTINDVVNLCSHNLIGAANDASCNRSHELASNLNLIGSVIGFPVGSYTTREEGNESISVQVAIGVKVVSTNPSNLRAHPYTIIYFINGVVLVTANIPSNQQLVLGFPNLLELFYIWACFHSYSEASRMDEPRYHA
ncbi:hypothetical protein A2U01_0002739, partial [Trifolium medium]|nr:hypothetical protein [Trifolium medium]